MEETPRRPVAKTVGAVDFVDDYDWLQRGTDEALAWMWRRDAEAQAAVEAIPGYAGLKHVMARAQGQASEGASAGNSHFSPRLIAGLWFKQVSAGGGVTAPSPERGHKPRPRVALPTPPPLPRLPRRRARHPAPGGARRSAPR